MVKRSSSRNRTEASAQNITPLPIQPPATLLPTDPTTASSHTTPRSRSSSSRSHHRYYRKSPMKSNSTVTVQTAQPVSESNLPTPTVSQPYPTNNNPNINTKMSLQRESSHDRLLSESNPRTVLDAALSETSNTNANQSSANQSNTNNLVMDSQVQENVTLLRMNSTQQPTDEEQLLSPFIAAEPYSENAHLDDLESAFDNSRARNSFPRSVYFIIGNEFCERFSFYGMKSILYSFLLDYLMFSEVTATTVYHTFVSLAYFFPLLGAILADSYLGKYKTIVYLSLVYCLGNLTLAVTSVPGVTGTPPHWWGLALGLFLLAVGTGGIKPCVASFGGDQFHSSQVRETTLFFTLFYFAINSGSFLSMLVTPNLRAHVSCFGQPNCFPLAFGVPAVLMLVATMIFMAGSGLYVRHMPQGNVFMQTVHIITHAWRNHARQRRATQRLARSVPAAAAAVLSTPRDWLLSARDLYPESMLRQVRQLLRVLKLFLPLCLFWTLYDQQGSRWTEQARQMDGRLTLFGTSFVIASDLMQVWNAILILVLIPLFENCFYPMYHRWTGKVLLPLQRIVWGLFLLVVAFVMAALLQWKMDESMDENGHCPVPILWQVPQYFVLTCSEIMVSISGLEFAYSQAPSSMKSVCQSAWLLAVAVGNVLTIAVTQLDIMTKLGVTTHKAAWTNLLFAGLLLLDTLWFMIWSRRYRYVRGSIPDHSAVVVVPEEDVYENGVVDTSDDERY